MSDIPDQWREDFGDEYVESLENFKQQCESVGGEFETAESTGMCAFGEWEWDHYQPSPKNGGAVVSFAPGTSVGTKTMSGGDKQRAELRDRSIQGVKFTENHGRLSYHAFGNGETVFTHEFMER